MKSDELIAKGYYQLFRPTGKADLLADYPELRGVASFAALSPPKMMFVWWYAARWSPAQVLRDDKDKVRYCVMKAWDRPPKDIMEKYVAHQWGAEVSEAIDDMRGFEPLPRVVMKATCMDLMDKVKGMLSMREPTKGDFPDVQDYYKAVGEYLKAVKQAVDLQNTLLPYTEHNAFGVTRMERSIEEEEGEIAEWLLTNRD